MSVLNQPSIAAKIKELETLERMQADPRLAPYVRNFYPLTGKAGNTRRTKKTLGQGTFGRVNLEELNEGNVATKYFLDAEGHICENVSEVATLRYLKGKPNVAQLVRIDPKPVSNLLNEVAPIQRENMNFPAVVLGKAVGTLTDYSLYKSWDDVYSTIVQILRGYFILHNSGIVHRDTKPQNMLMTATGEVWISDFGAAKYLDTHIPVTKDTYTGTYSYAAPDLLMKHVLGITENDYYKSDAWAVGASILHILRQRAPFLGTTLHTILDYIFTVKGTPDVNDGEVFTLYQSYIAKSPLPEYEKIPDIIKQRVLTHTVLKPSDPAILEKVADIVAGLLEYDPAKRLSISDAIAMLPSHNRIPLLQPRLSLLSQYQQNTTFPPSINEIMIDVLFNWLHNVVNTWRLAFSDESKHIVLDRTGFYLMSFFQFYKGHPYAKREHLQLIGCVALLLASCFFDNSEYALKYSNISEIEKLTANAYTKEQILECIKMYMLADINYYGRTFLDNLLLSQGPLTREEIETFGLLNYVCYQKDLFRKNVADLSILQDEIIAFVKDENVKQMQPKLYLSEGFLPGERAGTKPIIKKFIDYVTPAKGGKRKGRKQTKRVKKRRYNTTLKFRNGRIR